MPPSKKKPAPKKAAAKKKLAKRATAKKPAASVKRVTRKPRTSKVKIEVPAMPPSAIPTDDQGFQAAIKQAPDDLTVHLAYADWLANQGFPSRAAVLRAWTELVRVPITAGVAQLITAHQTYSDTLLQKDADWIEELDKVRRWISKPIAEKIVRTFIDDIYGRAPAETWTVAVQRCMFDDRWSGAYEGELEENGQRAKCSGTFYVNQITGSGDGHVTTL